MQDRPLVLAAAKVSSVGQITLPKMVRTLLGVEGEVGKIKGRVVFFFNDAGDVVVREAREERTRK